MGIYDKLFITLINIHMGGINNPTQARLFIPVLKVLYALKKVKKFQIILKILDVIFFNFREIFYNRQKCLPYALTKSVRLPHPL